MQDTTVGEFPLCWKGCGADHSCCVFVQRLQLCRPSCRSEPTRKCRHSCKTATTRTCGLCSKPRRTAAEPLRLISEPAVLLENVEVVGHVWDREARNWLNEEGAC
ncbi:uncharacterized protein K460DRAFT_371073 [Cucurbitaria berberidis CBS 394.84]|uniref:Uncharacterized protein n=1 Tax=Cucurbitaria berberidis CBS 394.84 TaxID=1168544 RepID=A0A9P4L494_9PLEO|nr:uncharacterized protein K460DRAFT_371073 [Cucurbitaria berberidis CBS 394.84]KAF1841072.1 hypothetical protein K460DRAFT_371073 [Cucurbitaria berberidis CBS 394.84]